MVQRDDASLALGQALDRGPHLGRLDGGEHDLLGSGGRVDERIGPVVAGDGVERHGGEPAAAGPAIGRGADQPQEPGRERGRVLEAVDMAKCKDERFLGDIRGLVQIAAQTEGGGDRDVLETVDERRPGSGITPLRSADQRHPTLPILDQRHHQRGACPARPGYRTAPAEAAGRRARGPGPDGSCAGF